MNDTTASNFNQRAPIVDGEELPDGYGISFEWEYPNTMLEAIEFSGIRPAPILTIWLTQFMGSKGYVKVRQLDPRSTILCWDGEGRAWEYEHGQMKVISDNLNLQKEYFDPEGVIYEVEHIPTKISIRSWASNGLVAAIVEREKEVERQR